MITGVRRVGLRVNDVDEAEAFYRDVVGLEPIPSRARSAARASDGVTAPAAAPRGRPVPHRVPLSRRAPTSPTRCAAPRART